jgi:hypothetical protein
VLSVAMRLSKRSVADPLVVLVLTGGGHCKIGGSMSITVTLNSQSRELPAKSTAEQRTRVAPTANVVPGGGMHVSEATPTLSLAIVTYVMGVVLCPGMVGATMELGQVMEGGVKSERVTWYEHEAMLFAASRATHVIVVGVLE